MREDRRNQEIGLNLVCGSNAVSRTSGTGNRAPRGMRGAASCLAPQFSRHSVAEGRGLRSRPKETE